jgi:hypothetical protein
MHPFNMIIAPASTTQLIAFVQRRGAKEQQSDLRKQAMPDLQRHKPCRAPR